MEFKFRAGDFRPPQYASSPPSIGCVSEYALPDPCLRRNTDVTRKPCYFNEAMHRELEMMRFREGKLLAEIERERILRAEARRDLMMVKREMTIQRVARTGRLSFYDRRGMPFSTQVSVIHPFHGRQLEEQLQCHDRRSPDQEIMAQDDKRQVKSDESEFVVLEKTRPKSSTVKPKVEMPLLMAVEDIIPQGVTKNAKDEWSCALCRVTATSERSFNQHLRGKKHKGKEAGLRAERVRKTFQATPASKKRRKLLEVMETKGSAGARKQQELKVGESLQYEETGDVSNQKTIDVTCICSKGKEGEKQMQNQCVDDPRIKHEAVTAQNSKTEDMLVKKKKFKFWCQMCRVGAYIEAVMDAHVKGRKHKARLREFGQNYGITAIVTEQEKRNSTASDTPQFDK